jgi:hypothetical protein
MRRVSGLGWFCIVMVVAVAEGCKFIAEGGVRDLLFGRYCDGRYWGQLDMFGSACC